MTSLIAERVLPIVFVAGVLFAVLYAILIAVIVVRGLRRYLKESK